MIEPHVSFSRALAGKAPTLLDPSQLPDALESELLVIVRHGLPFAGPQPVWGRSGRILALFSLEAATGAQPGNYAWLGLGEHPIIWRMAFLIGSSGVVGLDLACVRTPGPGDPTGGPG